MLKGKSSFSYTTIEVLFVIILLSVWLVVVLPRFGAGGLFSKTKLKSAAGEIVSDTRYARSLAISNARIYIIYFDFTLKEYKIYKDSIAPANQIGATKKIPQEIACSGTNQFNFTSLGSATFSGSGVLTLTVGIDQYQITVAAATGAAYIQKL